MADQNSNSSLDLSRPDQISWAMIEQLAPSHIVCLTPVRTVVRAEQEIVVIKRVRKVEEIDSGLACPINTVQVAGPEQEGAAINGQERSESAY